MSLEGEVFFQFKLSSLTLDNFALSSPHYAWEKLSSLQELFDFSFSDTLVRRCFHSTRKSLAYCPVITLCAEHSQLGRMRGELRRTERQVKKFS